MTAPDCALPPPPAGATNRVNGALPGRACDSGSVRRTNRIRRERRADSLDLSSSRPRSCPALDRALHDGEWHRPTEFGTDEALAVFAFVAETDTLD